MIQLHLSDIARPLQAVLTGQDVEFCGCSTDTRTLQPAELFIALKGERFDGHGFVAQARESGAAAAMLEHPVDVALPALVVGNTRVALGQLAALWRSRFTVPIVAVTGSNGKTTVKEMLAAILSLKGAVLATRGNLNNDIGVPQTLCRLGGQHDYAVIELGAN
ncbi:MAG TPA: Mur ligase family protein, partial [Gammaproteobacteria bacterium]|nr:Mur ligase family protein [Gammaproteobacteria bacterium]